MKNNQLLILFFSLTLMMSCKKNPSEENGTANIKDIAFTSNGISTLDGNFTINTTLPNSKEGEVIKVELRKQKILSGGGTSTQLVPLSGTQQTVTVKNDLTVSISYSRAEAQLNNAGDSVYVNFAGKTASASTMMKMIHATLVSTPEFNGTPVNIIRGAGIAWLDLKVQPKSGVYSGTVVVMKKNGMNAAWTSLGNFKAIDKVAVSGDFFAVGKDTMYYAFISQMSAYTDTVNMSIINHDPYFLFKKSGTMAVAGSSAGLNLFINAALPANDANAMIAVDEGTLMIHGGTAWAVGGKSISFVSSTISNYHSGNATSAMATYMAGTPTATAAPAFGEGVYVFKIVNGPNPLDIFYGMLKFTSIIPGVSVSYEYRIGNTYDQLSVIR